MRSLAKPVSTRVLQLQSASELLDAGEKDQALRIVNDLGIPRHEGASLEEIISRHIQIELARPRTDKEERGGAESGSSSRDISLDTAAINIGIHRPSIERPNVEIIPDLILRDFDTTIRREFAAKLMLHECDRSTLDGFYFDKSFRLNRNSGDGRIAIRFFLLGERPLAVVLQIGKKDRASKSQGGQSLSDNMFVELSLIDLRSKEVLGYFEVGDNTVAAPCFEEIHLGSHTERQSPAIKKGCTVSEDKLSFNPRNFAFKLEADLSAARKLGTYSGLLPTEIMNTSFDDKKIGFYGHLPGGEVWRNLIAQLTLESDLDLMITSGDIKTLIEWAERGRSVGIFHYLPAGVDQIYAGFRGASR